jgi:hypothetical protein
MNNFIILYFRAINNDVESFFKICGWPIKTYTQFAIGYKSVVIQILNTIEDQLESNQINVKKRHDEKFYIIFAKHPNFLKISNTTLRWMRILNSSHGQSSLFLFSENFHATRRRQTMSCVLYRCHRPFSYLFIYLKKKSFVRRFFSSHRILRTMFEVQKCFSDAFFRIGDGRKKLFVASPWRWC